MLPFHRRTEVLPTYSGFSVAFAVWMLQSYFETIPREIEEAAHIDGASWLATLRYVFLPLAMPAIGVTAAFTFISAWTDFILAFTLLRTPEKLTATMKLFYLVSGTYHVDWNEVMAAFGRDERSIMPARQWPSKRSIQRDTIFGETPWTPAAWALDRWPSITAKAVSSRRIGVSRAFL